MAPMRSRLRRTVGMDPTGIPRISLISPHVGNRPSSRLLRTRSDRMTCWLWVILRMLVLQIVENLTRRTRRGPGGQGLYDARRRGRRGVGAGQDFETGARRGGQG